MQYLLFKLVDMIQWYVTSICVWRVHILFYDIFILGIYFLSSSYVADNFSRPVHKYANPIVILS